MKFNPVPLAVALIAGTSISLAWVPAHAAKLPHSLVTDDRVKQV
ncbi:mating pair formation protein, partial [Xanthomonas citri pv. citri]|nr:mating pair formation protein [Xanthomonas citri pv. citri]